MILLLIGPPGAGKGTQGEILAKEQGFLHLSTGELMRQEITGGTELGSRITMLLENGYLVDDETTLQLVQRELTGLDPEKKVVCDGFPRTEIQAKLFDSMLSSLGRKVDMVIDLGAPRSEVAGRLKLRARNDDTDLAIEQRLTDFEQQTKPLIEYYRSHGTRVQIVDGTPDIQTVAGEIKGALGV
jgi:adenylate kinase